MSESLASRTGQSFIAVGRPEELTVEHLVAVDAELVFLTHWSWRIPPEIHERWECVIFHMTDVPYGRGGTPLQNLIVRGHRETRISALRCTEGLDAGPVYLKRPLSLQGSAQDIYEQANAVIEDMIVELVTSRPAPVPQSGEPVVFPRRTVADGDLRDIASVAQAYDHIRMLDAEGYPPAFLETDHLRLEFGRARLREGRIVADVTIVPKTHDE
jgi:methionyl-tRNA formyltransferase